MGLSILFFMAIDCTLPYVNKVAFASVFWLEKGEGTLARKSPVASMEAYL